MSELTVIGIGSPFGDDRLGWQIIECLQAHPQLKKYNHNQLNLQACDRPGAMLFEYLRDTRQAIMIDAVLDPAQPGEIVCLNEQQIGSNLLPISSHGFGVAEVIMLGRQLGNIPVEIMLLGITTDAYEAWSFSNEQVQQLCDRVVQQIDHSLSQSAISI